VPPGLAARRLAELWSEPADIRALDLSHGAAGPTLERPGTRAGGYDDDTARQFIAALRGRIDARMARETSRGQSSTA
jgi:hypothetical protein